MLHSWACSWPYLQTLTWLERPARGKHSNLFQGTTALSKMTLIKMVEGCYAESHLCWVSCMLSVLYAECLVCWVSCMLSVVYAECCVCWVLCLLSVVYAECHKLVTNTECLSLCWVSSHLFQTFAKKRKKKFYTKSLKNCVENLVGWDGGHWLWNYLLFFHSCLKRSS